MDNTGLVGRQVNGNCNRVVLNFNASAHFTNFRDVRNLACLTWSNHPIVRLCDTSDQIKMVGAEFWDESGGSFFKLINAFLFLDMSDGAILGDDDGDVISVDGDSMLIAHITGSDTEVGDYTIGGCGTALVMVDGAASFNENQGISDLSVCYSQNADQLQYNPDDTDNWVGDPSTVAEGLDDLALQVAQGGMQARSIGVNFANCLSNTTPDLPSVFPVVTAPAGAVVMRVDIQVAVAFDGSGGGVMLNLGGLTQSGINSVIGDTPIAIVKNPSDVGFLEISSQTVNLTIIPGTGQSLSSLTQGQVNVQLYYYVPPPAPVQEKLWQPSTIAQTSS